MHLSGMILDKKKLLVFGLCVAITIQERAPTLSFNSKTLKMHNAAGVTKEQVIKNCGNLS